MGKPLAEEPNQLLSDSSEDLDWFLDREISGMICKDAETASAYTDSEREWNRGRWLPVGIEEKFDTVVRHSSRKDIS